MVTQWFIIRITQWFNLEKFILIIINKCWLSTIFYENNVKTKQNWQWDYSNE